MTAEQREELRGLLILFGYEHIPQNESTDIFPPTFLKGVMKTLVAFIMDDQPYPVFVHIENQVAPQAIMLLIDLAQKYATTKPFLFVTTSPVVLDAINDPERIFMGTTKGTLVKLSTLVDPEYLANFRLGAWYQFDEDIDLEGLYEVK